MAAKIARTTEETVRHNYSKPLKKEERGKVYALRRAGWTVQEIAADLGKYEYIVQDAADEYDADPEGVIKRTMQAYEDRNKAKGKEIYKKKKEKIRRAANGN